MTLVTVCGVYLLSQTPESICRSSNTGVDVIAITLVCLLFQPTALFEACQERESTHRPVGGHEEQR